MDTAVTEQKIQEVVNKIVKEYHPEKIILFGSWAWGEPRPDSDVDLFIVKRSQDARPIRERKLQSFLSPREIPIDILVYTPEEVEESVNKKRNLFIEDIVRNGKVLYTKPESVIIALPRRPLTVLH